MYHFRLMDATKTTQDNDSQPERQKVKLTDMESQVMDFLKNHGWYNWGSEHSYSDVESSEIAQVTNIDMNRLRGVLASLVKKNLIHLEDMSNHTAINYVIVYPLFNTYVHFDEVDEWVADSFPFDDDALLWLKENNFTGESYYDEIEQTWIMKKVA